MTEWIANNEKWLLVLATFSAAAAAIIAAWTVARAETKNRRAAIREKMVGDFRATMAEYLAVVDAALNRHHRPDSAEAEHTQREHKMQFFRLDNSIELLIGMEEEESAEKFRDAVQDLKIAYSDGYGEFEARSRVVAMAKNIIQHQLNMARLGK